MKTFRGLLAFVLALSLLGWTVGCSKPASGPRGSGSTVGTGSDVPEPAEDEAAPTEGESDETPTEGENDDTPLPE